MDSNRLQNLPCVLFLFTLVTSVSANSCSPEEACLGGRPRSPNGCCPTLPGQFCEGDGECDGELGFVCVETSPGEEGGLCQGQFNLRAVNATYTDICINWQDFAPVSYDKEYIVFWTTNFTRDMTEWQSNQVGRKRPSAHLENLQPGTLYFIRIGTWEDAALNEYSNLTEVIMVRTLAGCQRGDGDEDWVAVGDEWVTECETSCQCVSTANLTCRTLCPTRINVSPSSSSDCVQVPAGEDFASCCTDLMCTDGSCVSQNGTRYNNNTTYETPCEACVCVNGESLCTDIYECTDTDMTGCQRRVEIETDNCCPQYECLTECLEGNVTYRHGDPVSRSCNERCFCQNGWVQCERICPEVDLPPTPDCPFPVLRFPATGNCAVRYCGGPETAECVIHGLSQPILARRIHQHCQPCACPDEHSYRCDRGCFSDVSQIPATSACPSPHFVDMDGDCCPQIWCENATHTESTANSMIFLKVSWLTTDSFTLTFNVPRMEALEGTVLGYDILHSASGSSASPESWTKTSLNVSLTAGEAERDASAAASDTSWLGNDTVRTVVRGLTADSAYLVRVRIRLDTPASRELSPPSSGLPTWPGRPVSVTAVLPPVTGYKCWIKGRNISHGEQYQDGCDVICSCSYGELECVPVCPVDPPNCPRPAPVPVVSPGHCCGRTKCYGKPGCCPYGSTTIEDGEVVRERCDRSCRCDNGTLTCRPVCSHLPPPNPSCTKIFYKDRCCPTWRCPAEKQPPSAMAMVVRLKLSGVCDDQNEQFLQQLVRSIIATFRREGLCPDYPGNSSLVFCSDSQMAAFCPQFTDFSRHKRHTGSGAILVLITIKVLNKDGEKNFTGTAQLEDAVGRLRDVTSRGVRVTLGNTSFQMMTSVDVIDRSILCKPGYLKYEGGCMAGHVISSNRSVSYHIELTAASLTESSATLRWTGLPHIHMDYLDAVLVEYRDVTGNGSWVASGKLHVSVGSYRLVGLAPARLYLARLLLLTASPGLSRYTAALHAFRTRHIRADLILPEITSMDVGESSVTVHWSKLTPQDMRLTRQCFLVYCKVTSGQVFLCQRSAPLSAGLTQYRINSLSPDTIYSVKLELLLLNGTRVLSLPADVRTKKVLTEPESHVGVLAGVSVLAGLAVTALVTLAACSLRRGHASSRLSSSSGSQTNFENKMFDMDTEESTSCDKPSS